MFEDLKKITELSSIKDKDIFYEASFNIQGFYRDKINSLQFFVFEYIKHFIVQCSTG